MDATNATHKKVRISDADMVKAIKASGGMVYHAAGKLECAPSTIYRRADASPTVAAAIEDARGEMLDDAETSLKAAVKRGEAWAVCFALKTIGKGRGYVERTENTIMGDDDKPLVFKWPEDLGGAPS